MITTQQYMQASTQNKSIALSALQVLGASFLLAFCSQLKVPLFFTPVPLSCQTLAVMLIGALLGSRKGLLAVLAYLAEGAAGLPFFAGGSCGIAKLFGPTGGYFLGFALQAYVVGLFFERKKVMSFNQMMSVLLFSCFLQLTLGVLWLAQMVSFSSALTLGAVPFLFSETLKCFMAAFCLRKRYS